MPCCGGGSSLPGGTSSRERRTRSGSSSLITIRSNRGRSSWRMSPMLTGIWCDDAGMSRPIYEPDVAAFLAPLAEAGAITVAVMVSSVDGRATVGGQVGELTGTTDQEVLLGVRELASAVVFGGRTVRAEGYASLLGAEAQARRRARDVPAEPEL